MFDPELNKVLTDEEVNLEIASEKKALIKETIFTAVNKVSFANQIKNGLGAQIKANPKAVVFVQKPWTTRFKEWLTKVFTKF